MKPLVNRSAVFAMCHSRHVLAYIGFFFGNSNIVHQLYVEILHFFRIVYLSVPELILFLSVSQKFLERSFILICYYLVAKVPALLKDFY
jgi:hypothetical protein